MITADNGRGVHPRLRTSTLRFWTFDDVIRGTAFDLSANASPMGDQGGASNFVSPQIVDSIVGGKAIRCEDSAEISRTAMPQNNFLVDSGDTASRDAIEGEFTIGFWYRDRRDESTTNESLIYSYMGDDGLETADENYMFSVRAYRASAGDRISFELFWEYDAGANIAAFAFSDVTIPKNKWAYVVFRRREAVAGVGSAGVVIVDLYVNGVYCMSQYGSGTPDTPTGTWTWDGTTTVLATDTSGVAVNDYIQRNTDDGWHWWRITAINAGVDVTIDNVDSLTIPTGTGIRRRDPTYNTSGGANAVHIVGGKYQGSAAAVTDFGTFDMAGLYIWSELLAPEDIEDDFRRGLLLPFYHRIDTRVEVEPAASSLAPTVDLTDYYGLDWLISADITDDIDNSVVEARVTFMREQENMSLATLKTDTPPNLEVLNDPASFDPTLDVNREIKVKTARVPLGIDATPRDYVVRFDGLIDEVDWGSESVRVSARDLGSQLIDHYIEQEDDWGTGATATLEATIQRVLDLNDVTNFTGAYPDTTLFTPVASQWVLQLQDGDPAQQLRYRREPVLTTLRSLSAQIGWECRYRYDLDPDQPGWRLTLFEPDRARLDADVLIRSGEVLNVGSAKINQSRTRNVVRIVYPTSETFDTTPTTAAPTNYTETYENNGLDGQGLRTVAYYQVEGDNSIIRYGRRFMEVQERGSSQIDSIDEAQRMALAMISDLEEPELEHGVTLIPLPELDVCDMSKFDKNEQLFTGQQRLAVRSVKHSLGDRLATEVQLRGKPSVGFLRWLSMETRPGVPQSGAPPVISPVESLTDVQRGSLLQFVTGLIDRTTYLTNGKFLAIRNNTFTQYSRGLGNPPDGWRVSAGTWGTSTLRSSTDSLSGGRSIEIGSAAGLETDYLIDIAGDVNVPYSFEMTLKRGGAGSGDSAKMEIDWIEDDRTTIDTTSDLQPGGLFPGVAGDAAWHTIRVDGIHVPASVVRYARIRIEGLNDSGPSAGFVDSVAMYRTSNGCQTKLGGSAPVKSAGSQVNAHWDDVSPAFDYGNQLVDDSATVNGDGHHFLGRVPGDYEVNTRIWVLRSASATETVTVDLWLVKNATFDGSDIWNVDGTVVEYVRHTGVSVVNGVGQSPVGLDRVVSMVETDKLSLVWEVTNGTGSYSASNGPTDAEAIFEVKLRGID